MQGKYQVFNGPLKGPENAAVVDKRGEIGARTRARAWEQAADDGSCDAPMACPRCRTTYTFGEQCPDCNVTLIEQRYLDAATEGVHPDDHAPSSFHNPNARLLGVAVIAVGLMLCGGVLAALMSGG